MSAYRIVHGGIGYGWSVTGPAVFVSGRVVVAGPFTSREQAQERAAEMERAHAAKLVELHGHEPTGGAPVAA